MTNGSDSRIESSGSSIDSAAKSHHAVLQRLNRRIGDLNLVADAFKETERDWDRVPVIFARDHPNLDAYDADPVSELNRIGGRIVGSLESSEVSISGAPSLRSNLNIHDVQVNEGIDSGKISLSTGFRTRRNPNGDVFGIRPHHVLLFVENQDTNDMPRDLGACILNKEGSDDVDVNLIGDAPFFEVVNMGEETSGTEPGKFEQLCAKIDAFVTAITTRSESQSSSGETAAFKSESGVRQIAEHDGESDMTDNTAEIAALNKQIGDKDAEIDSLNKAVAAAKGTIEGHEQTIESLNKRIAEFEKSAEDLAWTDVKNKYAVPAGWTDSEEKDAELRKMWKGSPDAFYFKVFSNAEEQRKLAESGQDGDEFSEDVEVGHKTHASVGVGNWNPATKKYE